MAIGSGSGTPVQTDNDIIITFINMVNDVEGKVGANTKTKILLNKSQELLVSDSKRRKVIDVTFTNGVLAIPENCLAVLNVAINNTPIEQYTEEVDSFTGTFSVSDSTGAPDYYKIEDEEIILDSKYTGAAQLNCIPRPTLMSADNHTVPLRGSELAAIAYALWQIYSSNENAPEAGYWQTQFAEQAQMWLEQDKKRYQKPLRAKKQRSWS